MLQKAKAATASAADATARTAKATKIKGEIMMNERSIKSIKTDLGPPIYEALLANNEEEVQRLFMEAKQKVEALEAGIASKRATVEQLKTPRGSSDADLSSAHPPPPGAPPAVDSTLPPGWRKTATAEGREDYYHETTGETSWTVPSSPGVA